MGDNYLKQQAGNFRRQRDIAMNDAELPSLFRRPDVITRTFHGIPDADRGFIVGETLWAKPERQNETLALVRDHQRIGVIEGDGAKALLAAWPDTEGPGIIPMTVQGVLDLSGVAELAVSQE
jgi:hypothetical protein